MAEKTPTFYIVYFFTTELPSDGFKRLAFLTGTKESIKRKEYFLGYSGSRVIKDLELKAELGDGNLMRLAKPYVTSGKKKSLWIDNKGDLWISDDNDKPIQIIDKSGLRRISKGEQIYNRTFKERIRRLQTTN